MKKRALKVEPFATNLRDTRTENKLKGRQYVAGLLGHYTFQEIRGRVKVKGKSEKILSLALCTSVDNPETARA